MKQSLLIVTVLVTTSLIYSSPSSYTITLQRDEQPDAHSKFRIVSLAIDKVTVGTIAYSIITKPHKASYIYRLHITPEHRSLHGAGKMLLYTAINDIMMAGGKKIELERFPFDLPAFESFEERDKQLKKWYQSFGFEQSSRGRIMRLRLPDTAKNAPIISSFSPSGVNFSFAPAAKEKVTEAA